MDSMKFSAKSRLRRAFAKIIHIQAATRARKIKYHRDSFSDSKSKRYDDYDGVNPDLRDRAALEALIAKLFASVSSVKAAYAELQTAQFPYDGEAIQTADEMVVNELKIVSELKQSYLKKQIDACSPQVTLLLAEIQEQQSLMKTYQVTGKKLEAELQRKDTEISLLRKHLDECNKMNDYLMKRLNSNEPLSVLENLDLSVLNSNHFIQVLHRSVSSIRCFVKLMIRGMESAGWDLGAAATAIQPDITFVKPKHRCHAFESFVSRVMFDCFHFPTFSNRQDGSLDGRHCHHFFDGFQKLNTVDPTEFLKLNPHSRFGKFCAGKYLHLVHPKMESSFFGNLNQRSILSSGAFPATSFFKAFAQMAKTVWLLHSLAFSMDPEFKIFQVRRNCRFSEVFMESIGGEIDTGGDFLVAFTVVPGFQIRRTLVQCQVYLSSVISPTK